MNPLRPLRIIALALALLAGCGTPPRPSSMPMVNAALPSGFQPLYTNLNAGGAGNVVLVVACAGRARLDTVREGNQTYQWEVDTFSVLSVEKGEWSDSAMSFVALQPPFSDGGPATGQRDWPYQAGRYFRFWLNTGSTPARIVGQQALVAVQ